jgi:hypothetical protein
LASKGSTGLGSHETHVNQAHERLGIQALNKNHGRRSSNLQAWGQILLNMLSTSGFEQAKPGGRESLLDESQQILAASLRRILEQDPLEVRVRGRSAENVIGDILEQAEEKGKCGDVAQYLVGAKLRLRLEIDIPALPANKGDRKSHADLDPRAGDFQVEDAIIEVAVGLPDEKHLQQIIDALEASDVEFWLLTRIDRIGIWKKELAKLGGIELKRVVISSVEAFVGQNVTEIGRFSSKGKGDGFRRLFEIYNQHWEKVITPGIQIRIKK